MTREEQKIEAIERMKLLKLHSTPINEFQNDNVINLSEGIGILFWLEEEQIALVKKFEEKYQGIVYHAIHNMTNFGELLTLIYVSKNKSEWTRDRKDLQEGYAFSYVINLSYPECSEFGTVGIKSLNGGLIRTA